MEETLPLQPHLLVPTTLMGVLISRRHDSQVGVAYTDAIFSQFKELRLSMLLQPFHFGEGCAVKTM